VISADAARHSLERKDMHWINLTYADGGAQVFVNLGQVVAIEQSAIGAVLRTTLRDEGGGPVNMVVKENAEAIFGAVRAGTSQK